MSEEKLSYEDRARALFLNGYSCSQSVFCAFCDKTGIDETTAKRLSSSFGGGLGRLREVCGAVSGMAMVAGCLYGYDAPAPREEKGAHYARIQKMASLFREQMGSIRCRELLAGICEKTTEPTPEERTAEYYNKRRKCADCVAAAAAITEKLIEGDGEL